MAFDIVDHNVKRWSTLAGLVGSTFPLELIKFNVNFSKNLKILDFGCGEGRFLQYLHENNYSDIIGCDASFEMCQIARTKFNFPIIHLGIEMEFSTLLGSNNFDVICLIGVLSSVIPYSQRVHLINKLRSILTDGGYLLICDFGISSESIYETRYKSYAIEPFTFLTEEDIYIHHFSKKELFELVNTYFKIVKELTIETLTIHGRNIPGHIFYCKLN